MNGIRQNVGPGLEELGACSSFWGLVRRLVIRILRTVSEHDRVERALHHSHNSVARDTCSDSFKSQPSRAEYACVGIDPHADHFERGSVRSRVESRGRIDRRAPGLRSKHMRPQSPFARASRILAVAAFASALLLPLSSAVALDTSQRSASEIQACWQQLQPACSGSIYSAMPRWSAPYAAGSLAPQFLQDGLNSMNYVRYLAGLPSDVTLDAADVDKAQHGAVLLAAGQFAHSQPKPSDMSQAFYDIANVPRTRATSVGATSASPTSTWAAWTTETLGTSTGSATGAGFSIRRS